MIRLSELGHSGELLSEAAAIVRPALINAPGHTITRTYTTVVVCLADSWIATSSQTKTSLLYGYVRCTLTGLSVLHRMARYCSREPKS
jgi:hypothetical protein